MLRIASRVCPVCASPGPFQRWHVFQAGTVVRCGCGLYFTDPIPADPLEVYGDDYYTSPDRYAAYQWNREAYRAGFRRKVRRIRQWHPRGGRLLDVGCAYGDFMQIAEQHGFTVAGVELSPAAAAVASEVGPVATVPWLDVQPHEPYDIITFIDALEHMADPVAALEHARAHLARDGSVVVMVPNAGSWFARLLGRRWHLWLPDEHLVAFTPTTLAAAAEAAGLRVAVQETGGYGRSVGEIVSVLGRGTAIGRWAARTAWLHRLRLYLNFGDLFVRLEAR